MTFSLSSVTTIKITRKPEGCLPPRSARHPSHSFSPVPVHFYCPATLLDPLASVYSLSRLSRADTLTLTSSAPSDLLNPVVCSAIDAPGFEAWAQEQQVI